VSGERCAGVKLSGAHRGEQCGGRGHYAFRGKMYCASHRTIAAAAPYEFTAARNTLYRRLGRAEAERAAQAAQVDAFEVL